MTLIEFLWNFGQHLIKKKNFKIFQKQICEFTSSE